MSERTISRNDFIRLLNSALAEFDGKGNKFTQTDALMAGLKFQEGIIKSFSGLQEIVGNVIWERLCHEVMPSRNNGPAIINWKINLIKEVRERASVGLRDAKEAVESYIVSDGPRILRDELTPGTDLAVSFRAIVDYETNRQANIIDSGVSYLD